MLFICLSIKLWESDFFLNKGNLNFRANFGEIIISGFVLALSLISNIMF